MLRRFKDNHSRIGVNIGSAKSKEVQRHQDKKDEDNE